MQDVNGLSRKLANDVVIKGHYARLSSSCMSMIRIQLYAGHADDMHLWSETFTIKDCKNPHTALMLAMDELVSEIQDCCIDQVPVKSNGMMLIRALFEGLARLRRVKRKVA